MVLFQTYIFYIARRKMYLEVHARLKRERGFIKKSSYHAYQCSFIKSGGQHKGAEEATIRSLKSAPLCQLNLCLCDSFYILSLIWNIERKQTNEKCVQNSDLKFSFISLNTKRQWVILLMIAGENNANLKIA